MKHKCTKCKRVYEDNSEEIISGCVCGNNRFFFVKSSKNRSEQKPEFIELEDDDNEEIIILDTETVNIIENGKYEIDINSLMETRVPVYKYSEGKYSIDLGKMSK